MCQHNFAKLHEAENCPVCFHDIFDSMTWEQIVNLYKECKNKRAAAKPFDYDKVYMSTVKFYIEKKKYGLEQANEIAEKVVKKQQQEWNEKQ